MDTNPKFLKMLREAEVPIPVSGQKLIEKDRTVVWKNVCRVGDECRECIVEMSFTKTKFYIVALDLEISKYHVVELFRPQANKIIKACSNIAEAHLNISPRRAKEWQYNSLHTLMTFLEFKYGKLCIKDRELLMQYQLYLTPEQVQ